MGVLRSTFARHSLNSKKWTYLVGFCEICSVGLPEKVSSLVLLTAKEALSPISVTVGDDDQAATFEGTRSNLSHRVGNDHICQRAAA